MSTTERVLRVIVLSWILLTASAASADVVTDWNAAALDSIRASNTTPPAASRHLAILHAAIYDAVNGIARTHEPYAVTGRPPASASRIAAASAAAHTVMSAFYPQRQAEHDALHESIRAPLGSTPQVDTGAAWGELVGAELLELRSDDGSADTAPFPGGTGPGEWRPTESFGGVVRPALLPLWGYVRPFIVPDVTALRPPPPPALDSAEYAEEVELVRLYGASDSAVRSAEETEIALFWGYGPGTPTPPGHWNEIAIAVSGQEGLALEENARLFALLNFALADAAIVSWDCKYIYNLWRPITAIALADTDGNPATEPDPEWRPLLETPPFPEYVSGHSTFSAAAAAVLAGFFGRDDVPFAAGSDDLPGVIRWYDSFSEAALESGVSRIYGGIHFTSGNQNGLSSGFAVGEIASGRLGPKGNRSRD